MLVVGFIVGLGLPILPGTIAAGAPARKARRPIRALLVTGGCCHDYQRQKLIITRGVSARAHVEWTVAHQGGTSTNAKIPVYQDPNWARGFDIVVHNECFANVRDVEWLHRVLAPHKNGTPAVLIHCAMHCYRTGTDDWFRFCGVQSPRHGPRYSYTVEPLQPDHPITRGLGQAWKTPRGELYHSVKLFDTATPLAQAKRRNDGKPQVCVWTNRYHDARVFATTIGHHNETMVDPVYLDMLTRGLLWAAGRDPVKDFGQTDKATNDAIVALATASAQAGTTKTAVVDKCCGEGNLAFGRQATASSEEKAKNNFARHAVDGDPRTRWCAANGSKGQTWQVQLGKTDHVKSLRIHWEKPGTAYQYQVEGSADGKTWKTIVDHSRNKKVERIVSHTVDAPRTRFLRVRFLGSSSGMWASFWEFEAGTGPLPKLPLGLTQPVSARATSLAGVTAPEDIDVTLYAKPPQVNYPVCLAAAPDGTVFVGVDKQGSLGKKPGQGYVLRLRDTDGDGAADQLNTFAKMDHPRGLFYDNHSLWVLHPPLLSVFHDLDHDGQADKQEVLIKGITTDQLHKRGADHTTNGIRMGIDGWLYIAVGDFGFVKATAADGRVMTRRGGGVLRVRPDGSEMEPYCWGLRNIVDVAVDPLMNLYTRDNTNDGGGWDIRLSHLHQSGRYGYPSLYLNFPDEIMPPLADYGGGSGCGSMFVHDLRWPARYGNTLYTCDWGRSEVFLHNLPAAGATFKTHQESFLKIPRPTDLDVDGSGRMYVASWKNGKFNFSGPNVGFVVQVTPAGFVPKPFPRLAEESDKALVGHLASPSAVYRLHASRELLRRGPGEGRIDQVANLAANSDANVASRAAAVFTLGQFPDKSVIRRLLQLATHGETREFAFRALTDRTGRLKDVPTTPFLDGLKDSNPRVRAQALISLGRLKRPETAKSILPHTSRKSRPPQVAAPLRHKQPDPDRVIPHLAVRALVSVGNTKTLLEGLDGPHHAGAQWALKSVHSREAVEGLIKKLSTQRDDARRQATLTTLIRLYHHEGDYTGDWWGTRPDTSGPYYDRTSWTASRAIAEVIKTAIADNDKATSRHLLAQLARHKVNIEGLPKTVAQATAESSKPIVVPKPDPNDKSQIANRDYQDVLNEALRAKGDVSRGARLFKAQSCIRCHTTANGQKPKGPHLVDIGKRSKPAELLQSILKPSEKIAQGFDTYIFVTTSGKVVTGFVSREAAKSVEIRQPTGLPVTLPKDDIEERVRQKKSMMPDGLVGNLNARQLADLLAYLQSLK